MSIRRLRSCRRRSDKKTPGHDTLSQVKVVTRSMQTASAGIVLITKIMRLIEVAATILGG